jgi:hypothetical protein
VNLTGSSKWIAQIISQRLLSHRHQDRRRLRTTPFWTGNSRGKQSESLTSQSSP